MTTTTTTATPSSSSSSQPSDPFLCESCGKTFAYQGALTTHRTEGRCHFSKPLHTDLGADDEVERRLNSIQTESIDEIPQDVSEELRDLVKENWSSIRTHFREGPICRMYNFRWTSEDQVPEWKNEMLQIFDRQTKRFKINFSHSLALYNKEDDKLRFFHSCANNARLFDFPMTVSNKDDLNKVVKELKNFDHLKYTMEARPDTKWVSHAILATTAYVTPIEDYPLGCADQELPEHIKHNPAIQTLTWDNKNRRKYTDNLCFFRCLALAGVGDRDDFDVEVDRLFRLWLGDRDPTGFSGMTLSDIQQAEDLFRVNIDLFQVKDDCLTPLLYSAKEHPRTIKLLSWHNHLCYIRDINRAARAFACPTCGKQWKQEYSLKRHQRSCAAGKVKESYPGGVYQPPLTPLETLRDNGIDVDVDFVFPYRATYDFECFFPKDQQLPTPGPKTETTAKHVPLSVSVASNVPNYEGPICFVTDGDPQKLVDRMVDYLETVSRASYENLHDHCFEQAYDQIQTRIADEEENPDAERLGPLSGQKLEKLLDDYLSELPVFGFNSSKYDLNVIKPYFFSRMVRGGGGGRDDDHPFGFNHTPFKFQVKSGNVHKCIATQTLKFLDITSYLAPGYSYAKYLSAYGVREEKGFFPYEYLDSLDKLNETQLPPHETFYSSLTRSNITVEQYQQCQDVWRQKGMRTLTDFLIFYNNKDVGPFLEALRKQIDFYRTLGLDMSKDGIGVPGLTLRYLFKTIPADSFFSLIDQKHSEIHTMYREQMVGGPSIIFHRYHERGVTEIAGEKVRGVEGYDANALYLWSLMQDQPTGFPIVRKKETNFRAEKLNKYGQLSLEWIEWVAHETNAEYRHKFNGQEQRLGKRGLAVDAYDPVHRVALQFHGCYWHGHRGLVCPITYELGDEDDTKNPITGQLMSELREKTEQNTKYLREQVGVRVIEIYECQWVQMKCDNPDVRRFMAQRFVYEPCAFPQKVIRVEHILEAVREGRLFGFIQCTLRVSDRDKSRFAELPPIFKNTMVGRDDIGEKMRAYAEAHHLLTRPRRTLISSYFGEEILLSTPLLRWYMSKGLVVDDVQQIIEYEPRACFKAFGESVTKARIDGDKSASCSILAETMKLLGNAAYGKTITDLARHNKVQYLDAEQAKKKVNEPTFKKLTHLTDDLYEVEMGKELIRWNLPSHIAMTVYFNAKLRLLSFYYDFLLVYFRPGSFQLCEMDTDSLYFALTAPSLGQAATPEKRAELGRVWNEWLVGEACDVHHDRYIDTKLSGQAWKLGKDSCPACLDTQTRLKRRPGLFKIEWRGNGIIALCSKTYYCFGEDKGDKSATKGLDKRQNQLSKDRFLNVLRTGTSGGGTNTTFRTDGVSVYTYKQQRNSLSYFYIKRKVLDDGVSTVPLSV